MYPISEQTLSQNRSYEILSPQGVVLHSTDTPNATAQNEHDYFNSAYRGASANYFVDWQSIVHTIPDNEVSWGCGQTGNHKYLNIEMCEPDDEAHFNEVWNRTVWLVASLCIKNGWATGPNVWSHRGISNLYGETNHNDPCGDDGKSGFLGEHGKTWDELLSAIDLEIENIKSGGVTVTEDNDPDIHLSVRVRTSKADALVAQIIALGYACKKLDLA